MAQYIDAFKNFFRPLSGAQKTLFVLLSVGILSLTSMLFYWALQPSYSILFGSLSSESAQEIVEELQSMGISYELRDNGQAIMVPRDKVYDLRLQFASEGASGSDYLGYELFDQNTLGMTDFMQQVNKKRALEGELARTISNLRQIESSRIHIVMPERSPFQEATVEPSASAILNLRKGQQLDKEQIQGIGALIAGSVEGLTIEDITILDQLGNRISEDVLMTEEAMAGSGHMRLKETTENYLTNKGQSMLDRVLGTGNSIVRVSTEHNFNKVVRESNSVDPESRVIISEEKQSETNNSMSQQPNPRQMPGDNAMVPTSEEMDESSVQLRNYEVSKTRETLQNSVGEIERISASILLNYKKTTTTNEEGEQVTSYEPRTQDELDQLRNTMASALGIQQDRGDMLTLTQVKFQDPYENMSYENNLFNQPYNWFELIRWAIVAVIILVIAGLAYRITQNADMPLDSLLTKKEQNRLSGEEQEKYLEGESRETEDIYKKKMSQEAKALADTSQATDEIKEFIDTNTGEAASYVRSMMRGVLKSET
ncbi:flagellar basal-body MS-ring/collar protein FliF [Fodinibius sediminis]|uniref:Flagellar M-ring protein n=1 Tax=Fodinibius sediminis TaxID=1214077 RepID=A0A521CL82_9BACT|nr:flagellar basal-body MS-ring/collar protein FliF [Fodinibius sediminis]SMO59450.1 flagellar M-ring protein FliF [Fodinibius sediminis]